MVEIGAEGVESIRRRREIFLVRVKRRGDAISGAFLKLVECTLEAVGLGARECAGLLGEEEARRVGGPGDLMEAAEDLPRGEDGGGREGGGAVGRHEGGEVWKSMVRIRRGGGGGMWGGVVEAGHMPGAKDDVVVQVVAHGGGRVVVGRRNLPGRGTLALTSP